MHADAHRNDSARVRTSFPLPLLDDATAQVLTFDGLSDGLEHIALQFGAFTGNRTPLVRLHSECLTGDVFGSQRCDCGDQLQEALRYFCQQGGLLLYLRQEGRGIGLYAKMDAYALQMQGLDTFDANRQLRFADDLRDYRCAAEMLQAIGIVRIRLLTNNPDKVRQIERGGIEVVERVPTGVYANAYNFAYLRAKAVRAQHHIDLTRAQVASNEP